MFDFNQKMSGVDASHRFGDIYLSDVDSREKYFNGYLTASTVAWTPVIDLEIFISVMWTPGRNISIDKMSRLA